MERKTVKEIFKRCKFALVILGLLLLVSSLFSVYTTDVLKRIIDKLSEDIVFKELVKLVLYYVFISLLQVLYLFAVNYVTSIYNIKKEMDIKIELIKSATAQKGEFYSRTNDGELYQTVGVDVGVATGFVINTTMRVLYVVFSLFVTVLYLLYLHWKLLIVMLVLQPLAIGIKYIIAKRIGGYSKSFRDCAGKVSGVMQEMFSRPLDIGLSGMRNFFVKRASDTLLCRYKIEKKLTILNCFNGNVSELINTLSICSVVLYGGYAVLNREMGIGTFVVFITYSQRLLSSVEALLNLTVDYSQVKPSLERISDFFSSISYDKENVKIDRSKLDISICNASFSYGNGNVLKKANYNFAYGNVYGIVGRTGEGKSTIVKLLLGYWPVQEGNIRIGEVDVQKAENDELERLFGYYPAEPIIFNDSLYNNIVLDKKETSDEKLYEVLNMMDLEETVQEMELKSKTCVGSNGCKLSAGEKQRVALSRIFFDDREVLILDEPTSALDKSTGKKVVYNILEYAKEKMVIIITHDTELLDMCNEIVHLENGILY